MYVNPEVPSVMRSNAEKKKPVEKEIRRLFWIDFHQAFLVHCFSLVNSTFKAFQSISQGSISVAFFWLASRLCFLGLEYLTLFSTTSIFRFFTASCVFPVGKCQLNQQSTLIRVRGFHVSLPVQAAVSRLSRSRTKSATFGGSGEAFVIAHSAEGLIFLVNFEILSQGIMLDRGWGIV